MSVELEPSGEAFELEARNISPLAGVAVAVRGVRLLRSIVNAVQQRWLDVIGPAAAVALWELAGQLRWIDTQFVPTPSMVAREGVRFTLSGELIVHTASSLARTFAGLLAALFTALPLGFLLASTFPRLTRRLMPLFALLGQVNAFSLFPLFVLFFGIGEEAKFAVIYWSCVWPLLFATLAGVERVDPMLIRAARSMGAPRHTLVLKVLLPATVPALFAGARVGTMVAFLMLIAAEMIGAKSGLGWVVRNSTINYIIPRMFLAAAVLAMLGGLLEWAIDTLERWVVRWKPQRAV